MSVLTDLKTRGVDDILITVTDNLNGFTDTISNVIPNSDRQICVVHKLETQRDTWYGKIKRSLPKT